MFQVFSILDRAGVHARDLSHVALHMETHVNQGGSVATHSREGGTCLECTSSHSLLLRCWTTFFHEPIVCVLFNVCTFFLVFASWGLPANLLLAEDRPWAHGSCLPLVGSQAPSLELGVSAPSCCALPGWLPLWDSAPSKIPWWKTCAKAWPYLGAAKAKEKNTISFL